MQDKKPDAPVSEDSKLAIVATPEYVNEKIEEHAKSRNHPNATLQDKGFVVLSNDVGSGSETMAATPKAVKTAYDLANAANNNASDRVPIGRKVNGYTLSTDITLKAEDIGAYTKAETDAHIGEVNALAATANQNAINANTNAENRLSKVQNGADIPDKLAFVNNIGLGDAAIQHQVPNFASVMVTGSEWRNFLIRHDSGLDVNFGSHGDTGYVVLQPLNPETGKRDTVSNFVFEKGVDGNVLALGYNGNVTIGHDGNLKPRSPTIQIYSSGIFTTNAQSEGAIVERLSKGTYLIKEVMGFSNDGTIGSIEIPRCQNDLPLIWIDHEVLPNGSIKLMTYHREHSDAPIFARNVREGYADGDLIDIPEGRFVSVRVQMSSAKG
ncbi:tail protein [Xenorhabdus mauleonii]|uniref:Phage tail fibre repeat-containing protein n=1 Tax=Xenorhabdus mauleonii TaxID=351675 RepID=A0A1I3HWV6_9GAMM|nr:tail protein [Xenorhabdus mauleonii]SFI40093.1 Phage tail fibre repeat-containing protein [Xenorhabdus mauleonii]